MRTVTLKFFRLAIAFVTLVTMLIVTGKPVVAQQDITPPALLEVKFNPEQIDTSKGPATITVTVHVTDDLSGFYDGALYFRNPDTDQRAQVGFIYVDWDETQGPLLDGELTGRLRLPQYAAYGEWLMYGVRVGDYAGNSTSFWKPDDGNELKEDEWPSLYNGFVFAVGNAPLQPSRQLFIPSLSATN